jgi:hypothetical protein
MLLDLGFTEFDVLARNRIVLLLDELVGHGARILLGDVVVSAEENLAPANRPASAAAENGISERPPIFRAGSCCKKWQGAKSSAVSWTENYDGS